MNSFRPENGTHIRGLQSALVDIINAKAAKVSKEPFVWNDIRAGLTVGLNIKLSEPQMESQAKMNLINPSAYGAVAEVVYSWMSVSDQPIFGQEFSNPYNAIIEKCKANRQTLSGQ